MVIGGRRGLGEWGEEGDRMRRLNPPPPHPIVMPDNEDINIHIILNEFTISILYKY